MKSLRSWQPGTWMAAASVAVMLASACSAGWIPWSSAGLVCVLLGMVLSVTAIARSGQETEKQDAAEHASPAVNTRRMWVVLIVAIVVHATTAVLVERMIPGDDIDTYTFQRQAAGMLLHGHDPYGTTEANVFNEHDTPLFYGPGMVVDGRVQVGFQYPPLTILWAEPGYLLGDVRYSYILAMIMAAVFGFLAFPGGPGLWFAGVLLVNPVGFNVENRAWTEPLVLMLLSACVYAAVRGRQEGRRTRWLVVVVGLFLASKQYNFMALALLGYLALPFGWRRYGRLLGVACCVGIATVLPFALWNFGGLWHDIVLFHLAQPFRTDALSLAVIWPVMTKIGPLLAVVCIVWALRWGARSVAMFAAAYATAMLIFVGTSKQAFCNYYFLIGETMLLAAAGFYAGRRRGIYPRG